MTIEQALKIKQNWTAEQARNDLERLLLTGERPANKVIALACKALDKQIPKKSQKSESGMFYICPTCSKFINRREKSHGNINIPHCKWCGQALEWSDKK